MLPTDGNGSARLVPGKPMVGEKIVISGSPVPVATVKAAALDADPSGLVTPIVPLVAPEGTVTISCVAVALVTVAGVPSKVTAFCSGVGLNAVP